MSEEQKSGSHPSTSRLGGIGAGAQPSEQGRDKPSNEVRTETVRPVLGAHRRKAMPVTGIDPKAIPENAPPILAALLVSYESNNLGRVWEVRQGQSLVARGSSGLSSIGPADSTIRDICIDHPAVSAKHARLFASAHPARLLVQDLNSTNGTYINDILLPSGQEGELFDGDRIRFGVFAMIVKLIR